MGRGGFLPSQQIVPKHVDGGGKATRVEMVALPR